MPIARKATLDILRRLAKTRLGSHLVLGGSSGLHAVSEDVPALTEDVDLLVDADWVAAREEDLLAEMAKAGFRHHPGTCTLSLDDGSSVDLVGYSKTDRTDRIGGGEEVPVMVFADLSTIMSHSAPIDVPTGGQALSPAALVVAKLLTIRQEKGSKDKLQALLLIDEKSDDESFLADVRDLFGEFEQDRIDDALADAQVAVMSLSSDADLADAQSVGYAEMREGVARGLKLLEKVMATGEEP